MKQLILPSILMLCGLSLIGGGIATNKTPQRTGENEKTIVKQVTDERGLTSVVFFYKFEPSDTLALDYLSPSEYKRQFNLPRHIESPVVCPDCGETNCIYEDIDTISGEGTDSEIEAAIQAVCKERGITDPKIIDLLRANYYL
jgi:hypothetical protein